MRFINPSHETLLINNQITIVPYLEKMAGNDEKDIQPLLDELISETSSHSEILDSMKTMKTLIGKHPNLYQEVIINQSEKVLKTSETIILNYLSDYPDKASVDQLIILLQFLHNLCVGQKEFCKQMWLRLESSLLRLLSFNSGSNLTNVLSAVVLQMLKHDCAPVNDTETMVSIVKALLDTLMTDDEIPFPLIVIQELIRNQIQYSIGATYLHLDLQHKLMLLDVIAEEPLQTIPKRLVEFLASSFKDQAAILMTVMKQDNITNPSETIRILKLIGTYSHSKEFIQLLQADKSLLIDAVYLLRMVHDSGKSNPHHMFGTVKNITEVGNVEKMESDPVFGFKRDLIRLIGNLCHEHTSNQDQVFYTIFLCKRE